MTVIAVTGLQWGDEGKGKLVDLLGEFAGVAVRYQGGNNAGHTVVLGDRQIVLNLLPSGALREHVRCVLAQGMVIDPGVLLAEMSGIQESVGPLTPQRLSIARRAHVILPIHRAADSLSESVTDGSMVHIGTTLRGIGPAYQDKAGRRGIRMMDLVLDPAAIEKKLEAVHANWAPLFEKRGAVMPCIDETRDACLAWGERLAPFLCDTSLVLEEEMARGTNVLLEGAQGTLLDIDHGTYPYVTSSNSCVLGAPAGAGLAPRRIDGVLGISKAYTTRVGGGPFPTEEKGEVGERLRMTGHEFGSTTGRPRRCGWLDVAALRYAIRLNGVDTIALTKLDVLTGLPEVRVCTGYKVKGRLSSEIPLDMLDEAQPVYETVTGWKQDITGVRDLGELPSGCRRYLSKLEGWLGIPVNLVSVGPGRNETIMVRNPFRE